MNYTNNITDIIEIFGTKINISKETGGHPNIPIDINDSSSTLNSLLCEPIFQINENLSSFYQDPFFDIPTKLHIKETIYKIYNLQASTEEIEVIYKNLIGLLILLKGGIINYNNDKIVLTNQCNKFSKDIANLINTNYKIQNNLKEWIQKNVNLKNDNNKLKNDYDKLENDNNNTIAQLKLSISVHENIIIDLNNNNSILTQQNLKLEEIIKDQAQKMKTIINNDYKDKIKIYIEEIDTLKKELEFFKKENYKSKIENLNKINNNLSSQINNIKQENTKIKNDLEELKLKNNNIEKNNKNKILEINNLKSKNYELENKNNKLNSKIIELNNKNSDLENKNSNLESKIIKLNNKNSDLESKIIELNNKNSELENKLNNFKSQNSNLKDNSKSIIVDSKNIVSELIEDDKNKKNYNNKKYYNETGINNSNTPQIVYVFNGYPTTYYPNYNNYDPNYQNNCYYYN